MARASDKAECPECGKINDKKDTVIHQLKKTRKYYCPDCYDEFIERKEGWDLLYNYICEIFDIDTVTGLMFNQLKEFRKPPYNYKDRGMYLTLKYCKEYDTSIKFNADETGLGIIPYYYERVKKFYKNIGEIEEAWEDVEISENIKRISIDKLNIKVPNFRQKIDEEIDWEDWEDYENEGE